jgi:hypothetical protein
MTQGAIVTTTDAETGEVLGREEMGPDSNYVLVLGPNYDLTHTQVFPKSGTVQLTIKRKESR